MTVMLTGPTGTHAANPKMTPATAAQMSDTGEPVRLRLTGRWAASGESNHVTDQPVEHV